MSIKRVVFSVMGGVILHLGLALGLAQTAGAVPLEAGQATIASCGTPMTVEFETPFATTPVVVGLSNLQNTDTAHIRIGNVTTTSFEATIRESDNQDGACGAMTFDFIAAEPGLHTLAGGDTLEVGLFKTDAVQHGVCVSGTEAWDTVPFAGTYATPPSLVASFQSQNSEINPPGQTSCTWITEETYNTGTGSFLFAMQRSEVGSCAIPTTEVVGYMALNAGAAGSVADNSGHLIQYEAIKTPDNVYGVQNGCYTYNYANTYVAPPHFNSKKDQLDGGDGGWVRECSNTATAAGIAIQEDNYCNSESNHTSEPASIVVVEQNYADVQVTKKVDDPTPYVGQAVTYTIEVTNDGPHPAQAVTVDDLLPAGVTLSSSSVTIGTYSAVTGEWIIGDMTNGQTETLTIVVVPDIGTGETKIENCAVGQSNEIAQGNGIRPATFDDAPSNNKACVTIIPEESNIAVNKTVSNANPTDGDTITFTITVNNDGPSTMNDVIVTDALPPQCAYVSDSATLGAYDQTTDLWTIGDMTAGQSAILQIQCTVDASEGTKFENCAVYQPHCNGEETLGCRPAAEECQANCDSKLCAAECQTTYEACEKQCAVDLEVCQAGCETKECAAACQDSNKQCLSGTVSSCPDGSTAGVPDTQPKDNESCVPVTIESEADLGVVKTVTESPVVEGSTAEFTITVTNNGPSTATNVTVTDSLPAGLTYASDTPTQGVYDSATGVWTVGTLTNGQSETLTITATATVIDGQTKVENCADMGAKPDQPDPNPDNDESCATVEITPAADLFVTKVGKPNPVNDGDTVTFTIVVSNDGPSPANAVTVSDVLPTGLAYVSDTTTVGAYDDFTGVWNVGDMAVGQTETLTITVTANVIDDITQRENCAATQSTADVSGAATPDTDLENNRACDTIDIIPQADIAVTKVADGEVYTEGDVVTFTITATNNGPSTMPDVQVSDALPAGCVHTGNVATAGFYSDSAGLWYIGDMTNGQTETLTITCLATVVAGQTKYENCAQYVPNKTVPDINPDNDQQCDTFVVEQESDIILTKDVNETNPTEGDVITFTLTVKNDGPSPMPGVEVIDLLPSGFVYVSDSPTVGAYDPVTGVWTVGTLADQQTEQLQIVVEVDVVDGDTMPENCANFNNTSDINDPDDSNHQPCRDVTTDQEADIVVTKTVSDDAPTEGDQITYTITVRNDGPSTMPAVVVTDGLPAGLVYVNDVATTGTYDNPTGQWSVGTLVAGQSETLDIIVTATVVGGATTVENCADFLNVNEDIPDTDPSNNVPCAEIEISPMADIWVQKSVNEAAPTEGEDITWTVTVTNLGPSPMPNVSVTDVLPTGCVYSGANTPSVGTYDGTVWAVGDMASLATETLDITCEMDIIDGETRLENCATFTNTAPTPDPVDSNNEGCAVVNIEAEANIVVGKTISNESDSVLDGALVEGGIVEYTVTVGNTGPSTMPNVEIVDALADWCVYATHLESIGTYDPASGVWAVGDLLAGQNESLTLSCVLDITNDITTRTNCATYDLVTLSGLPDDTILTDNQACVPIDILPEADISVIKAAVTPSVTEGQDIIWQVTVANAGPSTMPAVTVTDTLPTGCTYTGTSTASQGAYDGTVWTVGDIAAGGSATLTLSCLSDIVAGVTTIENCATFTSAGAVPDTDPDNDQSCAPAGILPEGNITVLKTVDDSSPIEGEDITWTVTVSNDGPSTMPAVSIDDVLPTGCVYSGAHTASVGTYDGAVWAIGDLLAGGSAMLTVTCQTDVIDDVTVLENCAEYVPTGTVPDTDSQDNQACATSTIEQQADVQVTKTVDNPTPTEGEDITWTVTVSNDGPSTMPAVSIDDVLPTGCVYSGANTATVGTYDGAVWAIGDLLAGASAELTVTCETDIINSNTNLRNCAQYTNGSSIPDTSVSNDSMCAEANIVAIGDLSVTKAIVAEGDGTLDGSIVENGTITWLVTVTNAGPSTMTGIEVWDTLPAGLPHQSHTASAGVYDHTTGQWLLGTLTAGQSETLSITTLTDIVDGATTVSNCAEYRGSSEVPDTSVGNDTPCATIEIVPEADIEVAKDVDTITPIEGDQVTFTVSVKNNGPSTMPAVSIDDLLPSGFVYVSDTPTVGAYDPVTGVWTLGDMLDQAYETLQITVEVDVVDGDTMPLNCATFTNASAVPDTDESNNEACRDVTTTLQTDMALTKVISSESDGVLDGVVVEGGTVTYTIAISNNGPSDIDSVTVTDVLPVGAVYVSHTESSGTYDPLTGDWVIGTMLAGQSLTLDITVELDVVNDQLTVVNCADFMNASQTVPDISPDNNHACASVTINQETDIAVSKSAVPTTPVTEGDTMDWVIVVTNNGPSDTAPVVVNDMLPTGTDYVSHSATDGLYDPTLGIWMITAMAAGDTHTLTITTVTDIVGGNTLVENCATYDNQSGVPETNTDNDESCATVDITPEADVQVAKASLTPTVTEADDMTWLVTVTNLGPSTMPAVSIDDVLPTGCVYSGANTPSVGTYDGAVWTIGDMLADAEETLEITCEADVIDGNTVVENCATYTNLSTVPDTDESNDQACAQTVIDTLADVSVAKQALTPTVTDDTDMTWQITVSNAGPSTAPAVSLDDVLPTGCVYSGVNTPTVGIYDGAVWAVGDLLAGATETLDITCVADIVDGNTVVENCATYTNTSTTPDVDLVDHAACAEVAIEPEANITVQKVTDTPTVVEGQDATWTVTVSNAGPSTMPNVVVTDTLPAACTYGGTHTASTGTFDGVTWLLGDMVEGTSATLTLSCVTDIVSGQTTLENCAEYTPGVTVPDTDPTDNMQCATVDITPEADVQVAKASLTPVVTEADDMTWLVTVTNFGPSTMPAVSIDDVLPTGCVYSGANTPSVGTYDGAVWTIGDMLADAEETLEITCEADVVDGNTVVENCATYTNLSTVPDTDESNDQACAETVIDTLGDLTLTKTATTDPIVEGQLVTFTIVASNAGPSTLTGVDVTDVLPTGLTYDSSTATVGAYDPVTGVWVLGTLTSGQTETLTLTALTDIVDGNLTPTNCAVVTSDELIAEVTLANNNPCAEVTLTPESDISVVKTTDATTVVEGDDVVWTITVTNNGPSDRAGVSVTDTLPAGLIATGWVPTAGSYDSVSNVWTVGPMADGDTHTLTLTTVTDIVDGATDLQNCATYTESGEMPDPVLDNNESCAAVDVTAEANVQVAKDVDQVMPTEGDVITFTVTVKNHGPSTMPAVTVADVLPVGLIYQSHTASVGAYDPVTGDWTVGTMFDQQLETLDITVEVDVIDDMTALTNCGQYDPTDSPVPDTDDTDNTLCRTVETKLAADILIEKTVDNPTPEEGELITFTVTVSNAGPSTMPAVTVNDPLPLGLTYASDVPSVGTYDPATGVWTVGDLLAGAVETLQLTVEADVINGDESPTNCADFMNESLTTPDTNAHNNQACQEVMIGLTSDLTVSKTADSTVIVEGDQVTFTIIVTNNGPSDHPSALVTDVLPVGLTYDSHTVSAGAYDPSTGTWSVGPMLAGDVQILTLVAEGDIVDDVTEVTNCALIGAGSIIDANPDNNEMCAPVTITPQADLAILKTVSEDTVAEGDEVEYTLTVTNNGPSTAKNVVVNEPLAVGLLYVTDTPSVGTYDPATGVWSLGDLLDGAVETLTIRVAVDIIDDVMQVNNCAIVNASGEEPTGDLTDLWRLVVPVAHAADGGTPDPDMSNNESCVEIDLTRVSDLQVTKTTDLDTVNPYTSTFTYTIDYANLGVSDSLTASITDTLPSQITSIVAITPSVTTLGNTVSCTTTLVPLSLTCTPDSGRLSAGESGQIMLEVLMDPTTPCSDSLTNTVTATDDTDRDQSDNEYVLTTPLPPVANVRVTKTGDLTANLRREVTYTIVYANDGSADALDTILTDTLPAHVTLVSVTQLTGATPWVCSQSTPGIVSCSADGTATNGLTVPAMDSGVIEVVVLVDNNTDLLVAPTTLHNEVSIETSSTEKYTDDNQDSHDTPIIASTDLGQLSGYVWYDQDTDVLIDGGESMIPSVTLILTGMDVYGNYYGPDQTLYPDAYADFVTQYGITDTDTAYITSPTTLTDASGYYLFDDLVPGIYNVYQINPPGYYSTGSDAGDSLPTAQNGEGSVQTTLATDIDRIQNIIIFEGDHSPDNNFGEDLGSIGNHIWFDAQINGQPDSTDSPISGHTVELWVDLTGNGLTPDDTLYGTTTTDSNGLYSFEDLPVDQTYVVTTSPPTGLTPVLGTAGLDEHAQDSTGYSVSLTPAAPDDVTADFAFFDPDVPSTVSGPTDGSPTVTNSGTSTSTITSTTTTTNATTVSNPSNSSSSSGSSNGSTRSSSVSTVTSSWTGSSNNSNSSTSSGSNTGTSSNGGSGSTSTSVSVSGPPYVPTSSTGSTTSSTTTSAGDTSASATTTGGLTGGPYVPTTTATTTATDGTTQTSTTGGTDTGDTDGYGDFLSSWAAATTADQLTLDTMLGHAAAPHAPSAPENTTRVADDWSRTSILPRTGPIPPAVQARYEAMSLTPRVEITHPHYGALGQLVTQGLVSVPEARVLDADQLLSGQTLTKWLTRAGHTVTANYSQSLSLTETVTMLGEAFGWAESITDVYGETRTQPFTIAAAQQRHLLPPSTDTQATDQPVTIGEAATMLQRALLVTDLGRTAYPTGVQVTVPSADLWDVPVNSTAMSHSSLWLPTLTHGAGVYWDVRPQALGHMHIFAHSSQFADDPNPYGQIFAQLVDDLNVGDTIFIDVNGQSAEYRIDDKVRVPESAVSALRDATDMPLTLMTCDTDIAYRWVWYAEPVNSENTPQTQSWGDWLGSIAQALTASLLGGWNW